MTLVMDRPATAPELATASEKETGGIVIRLQKSK